MSNEEKTNKALERLNGEVAALLSSDTWKAALKMRSRFHKYSISNLLLIWSQMPEATRVAGFKKWREFGRNVNKGEKGLVILAPMISKRVDPATGEEERKVYGFRTAYVFDVSQTSGEALPTVEVPAQVEDDSEKARGILSSLSAVATAKGFRLEFVDGLRNADGSFSPEENLITIVAKGSAGKQAKVLAHELAHGLARHGTGVAYDYALGELEAETTAFLVSDALGLETDAYAFHYLAHWTKAEGNLDALLKAGAAATRLADEILAALAKEVS